jgi:hypothetical protein
MARSGLNVAVALTFRCVTATEPFPTGVIPALEQIVCHVAENQTLENMAVQDICAEMSKVYPSGNVTCEVDMKKGWASFADQCKDMDHLADWIQEQFCNVSGNAALEAEVVAVGCGLVHHAVPGIPPFVCSKALQKTWGLLASECPKTVTGITEPGMAVGDIEKFICGVMENKTIEHQASQQICQYVTKVAPSANVTLCMDEVEHLWEAFESECKDIASVATWIRDEFCQNANNTMVENEFVAVSCSLAHYAAPQVPDVVCKTALQKAWSALASECPVTVTQPVQATILV